MTRIVKIVGCGCAEQEKTPHMSFEEPITQFWIEKTERKTDFFFSPVFSNKSWAAKQEIAGGIKTEILSLCPKAFHLSS